MTPLLAAPLAFADLRALLRLLQLTSPALPIGAFAYSRGLEGAVDAGRVRTPSDVTAWILGVLTHALATLDLPALRAMHAAFARHDRAEAQRLSAWLRAHRESAELAMEDHQLGAALARLLDALGAPGASDWQHAPHVTHAAMFALAAHHFAIDLDTASAGYLYAFAENQVTAAMRLLPLGQTDGQRILGHAIDAIPRACAEARALAEAAGDAPEHVWHATTPGVALWSARHETQYSRMFRS